MAEIALWNVAKNALAKAEEANQRAEAAIRTFAEHAEDIEKLKGELKALKARMGKRGTAQDSFG